MASAKPFELEPGDVVECLAGMQGCRRNHSYAVVGVDEDGDPVIWNDEREARPEYARCFKLLHRDPRRHRIPPPDVGLVRATCDALLETGGKPTKEVFQMLSYMGEAVLDLQGAMASGERVLVRMMGSVVEGFLEKANYSYDEERHFSLNGSTAGFKMPSPLTMDLTFKLLRRR